MKTGTIALANQQQFIDVSKMSPAELKELSANIALREKEAKLERQNNINSYKTLTSETVLKLAPQLADFGTKQTEVVNDTFKQFETLLSLKNELYGKGQDQSSHTFTDRDGSGSISIGWNEIIGFDGTETAGVQKIKEVIANLSANDENRETLAGLLNTFMKPDKKGNLNPTRIAELVSQKEKVNQELFSEGVDIIVNAQFKTRTTQYVRGWYKTAGENGKELKVTFSITAQ